MSNHTFSRMLSLLLVAAILMSCLCVFADDSSDDTYVFPDRTPVAFSEMGIDLFDAEAMDAALDDLELKLTIPGSFEDIKADYDVIVDQFDRICSDVTVAQLLYCLGTSDEQAYETYNELDQLSLVYSDRMCIVMSAAVESEYADELNAYINSEDVVADVMGYVPMTEEQFALQEAYNDLENRYYALDLESETVAEDAANLYLELLDNLIASASYEEDYNSYADYIYERAYFRDYTPDELGTMREWAKEFVVPALDTIVDLIYEHYEEYGLYFTTEFSESEIIETVQPYLSSVSKNAADAFSALLEYGVYDLSPAENKRDGGFTASLDYYGIPFIFDCPYGNAYDMETMIHEFGHYLQFYSNPMPMLYRYDCLDISEIDSQGLEMLMMAYADDIFGEELGNIARILNLYQILNSIIDGCVIDEFQQASLAARMEGTLNTAEEVTDLYLEIEGSYYGELYEYYGWQDAWYQVHHLYSSPFYYISYATSATAALGFLAIAEDNYNTAIELYNELIDMGCDKGFAATLDSLGLPNPLTEEGCARLTEGLGQYFEELTAA